MKIDDNCEIISIQVVDGKLTIHIEKKDIVPNNPDAEWIKEYKERTGKEPSIFDGD